MSQKSEKTHKKSPRTQKRRINKKIWRDRCFRFRYILTLCLSSIGHNTLVLAYQAWHSCSSPIAIILFTIVFYFDLKQYLNAFQIFGYSKHFSSQQRNEIQPKKLNVQHWLWSMIQDKKTECCNPTGDLEALVQLNSNTSIFVDPNVFTTNQSPVAEILYTGASLVNIYCIGGFMKRPHLQRMPLLQRWQMLETQTQIAAKCKIKIQDSFSSFKC